MPAPSDFRPLNPWGRPMPAPPRPIHTKPEPLYQVKVEICRNGQSRLIGPRMDSRAAGMLCEAIGRQIATGREKNWSNPTVVPVTILA